MCGPISVRTPRRRVLSWVVFETVLRLVPESMKRPGPATALSPTSSIRKFPFAMRTRSGYQFARKVESSVALAPVSWFISSTPVLVPPATTMFPSRSIVPPGYQRRWFICPSTEKVFESPS